MMPQLSTIRVTDTDLFSGNKLTKEYQVADPFLYVYTALRKAQHDWLIMMIDDLLDLIEPKRDARRIIKTENEVILYNRSHPNHTRSYLFINYKAGDRKAKRMTTYTNDLHRRINWNGKKLYDTKLPY